MADQKKYVNILSKKATSDNVEAQQIIASLNIVPNKDGQTITASGIVAGYSPINVAGVNASVDENIQPENIRAGVNILGVSGSVTELDGETTTVNPSTTTQTITPTSPHNGLTEVVVNPVTASVDSDIQPENIREGVDILGVVGTAECPEYYRSFQVTNNKLTSNKTINKIIKLDNVKDLDTYVLAYAYRNNNGLLGKIDMSQIENMSGGNCCTGCFMDCNSITEIDLSSLSTITGNGACSAMFYDAVNLKKANLSSLTTISGSDCCDMMFRTCNLLEDVDLSSLTTISSTASCYYMFSGCSSLKEIDLSSLLTIEGNCLYMFSDCTGLETVNLSSLTSIASSCDNMFGRCSSLETIDLSSLTTINVNNALKNIFQGCTSLTTLSFPTLKSNSFGSYTNQFNNMLSGVTGCTVHFPSNLQSVIGSWTSVIGGFGGTNTTVLFDLPETE